MSGRSGDDAACMNQGPCSGRRPPLSEVAPVPAHATGTGSAIDEVAATAVAIAPHVAAVVSTRRRRAPVPERIAAWPARRVVVLGALLLLCGGGGLLYLSGRAGTLAAPEPSLTVPGSGLTVDKPAGWAEGPAESAPAVLGDLLAGDTRDLLPGLYFIAGGDRTLFVVHAPDSARIPTVPPVQTRIGTATVDEQTELAHTLGPGRSLRAHGDDGRGTYELRATYVIAGGRIFLVGLFGGGELSDADVADYEAVVAGMRLQ